jgi:hypothetical protein
MRVLSRSVRGVLLVGATIGLLSACVMEPGKYTGGGTINSLGGAGRAQVAFTADSCNPDKIKGNVIYNDKTAIEYQNVGGVSFRGSVVEAGMCTDAIDLAQTNPDGSYKLDGACTDQSQLGGQRQCKTGQFAIVVDYTSTSPGAPGTGRAVVCSQSAGPGAGGDLHAAVFPISVLTGPFQGYVNDGTLVGNAQYQACKDGGA